MDLLVNFFMFHLLRVHYPFPCGDHVSPDSNCVDVLIVVDM